MQEPRLPFPGANFVGFIITLLVFLVVVAIAAGMPPGAAGFLVAFLLGLTVRRKWAVFFMVAGAISALLGFPAREAMVAWGGIGLVLAEAAVLAWIRI